MSEPRRIALVCEGPTDRVAIEAIIVACLADPADDFVLTLLQPEPSLYGGDAGPRGAGWRGVLRWCEETASVEALRGSLVANYDLLIIHLDGDVAAEPDIDRARACPPPQDTADALAMLLDGWMTSSRRAGLSIVYCIPTMSTEAWIFAALFPGDVVPCEPPPSGAETCLECDPDPAARFLSCRPRLVRMKQGKRKKQRSRYEAIVDDLTAAWRTHVVTACASARRFDEQLTAELQ